MSLGFWLRPYVLRLSWLGWLRGKWLNLRHWVRVVRRIWNSAFSSRVWVDVALGTVVVRLRRVRSRALVWRNVCAIFLCVSTYMHLSRRGTSNQNQQRNHVALHLGFSRIFGIEACRSAASVAEWQFAPNNCNPRYAVKIDEVEISSLPTTRPLRISDSLRRERSEERGQVCQSAMVSAIRNIRKFQYLCCCGRERMADLTPFP